MAFRLTFRISASMEVVLGVIKDDCREWRESVIPASRREPHVYQIVGEVRRRRFEWYYDCGGWDSCPDVVLRGRIEPRPDGTSSLAVWCGVPGTSWRSILRQATIWAAIAVGVLIIQSGGIGSTSEIWPLLKVALTLVALMWEYRCWAMGSAQARSTPRVSRRSTWSHGFEERFRKPKRHVLWSAPRVSGPSNVALHLTSASGCGAIAVEWLHGAQTCRLVSRLAKIACS